jgi:transcriptional regulator with XRE-family HTH domain
MGGTGDMPAKRRRLAQRRKTLGYSQEQLAEHLGVDRSTVVRWEAGETEPRPWQRRKIADVLDVSPERLEELLTEPDTAADDRLSRASDAEAEHDADLRREWRSVGEGSAGPPILPRARSAARVRKRSRAAERSSPMAVPLPVSS